MAKTMHPELSDAQERFCREYIVDFNGSAAFLRANPGVTEATARANASRLLARANIRARCRELQDAQAEDLGITVRKIVEELAAIATANPQDYYEWDEDGAVRLKPSAKLSRRQASAIQEISELQTRNGKQLKVKFYDRQAALQTLGRHFGMFLDKIDVSSGGEPVRIVVGNPWASTDKTEDEPPAT